MTKDSRAFIDKSRPSEGFLQNLFFSAADDPAGKLRSLKKALQAAILVNSVFLVIITALIYAIVVMLPLSRTEMIILAIDDINKKTVVVHPLSKAFDGRSGVVAHGITLWAEGAMTNFVTKRHSLNPFDSKNLRDWNKGGYVQRFSAPSVYNTFYSQIVEKKVIQRFRGQRLVRRVEIEKGYPKFSRSPYFDKKGRPAFEFVVLFKTIDEKIVDDTTETMQLTPIETTRWQVSATAKLFRVLLEGDSKYTDPFGFRVTDYQLLRLDKEIRPASPQVSPTETTIPSLQDSPSPETQPSEQGDDR